MQIASKKLKKIILFILCIIFFGNYPLKGTDKDCIEEESANLSFRALLSSASNSDLALPNLQLVEETDSVSCESDEEIAIPNQLSNSYLLSFQNNLDNGLSQSEALRYIICLAGGIGPIIPQIAIAFNIGENYGSDFLGYALIATSAVTIEAITSWMIWELIDDTKNLIKNARQSRENSSRYCNFLKSTSIAFSSAALGVLSSTPDVYIKYKYNSIKWLVFISIFYDSIPRTIGFCKLFSSFQIDKIQRIFTEPDIDEQRATKIVELSKAYFLEKCKEEGIEHVSESLKNFTSPNEIYSYLTADISVDLLEENSPRNFMRGIPRKIVKACAIVPPLASAAFNTAMAYKGYSLLLDNELSLWLLSGFSVLPTFCLSSYVVMEAAGEIFDKIYLCRAQIPSSNYFSKFYPELNIALFSTSLLLASATSFSSLYLISDNLDDTILGPIKYYIATLSVGTDFIFGTFTIYSTLKRYGEVICRKCSENSSYIINCLKKLSNFRNSFSNTSLSFIKGFIDEIE